MRSRRRSDRTNLTPKGHKNVRELLEAVLLFKFSGDRRFYNVFFARLQARETALYRKDSSSSGSCRRPSSVCHRVRASLGQPLRWSDPRAENKMIGALRSEEALSGRSPPPKHLKWVRVPHGGCWYPAPTGHVDQSGGRSMKSQKPPARGLGCCAARV